MKPLGIQQTLKALSDKTRQDILEFLKQGAKSAGEISAQFGVSGATISHHLSVLKDAGLISDEKKGKFIYYELNMSVLDEMIQWFSALKRGDDDEKN